MSDELNYIVMGDDGKEYGPVSAGQIRDWVRENRLERKTPVKPANAKDWVFLEMLPEFSASLSSAPKSEKRGGRKWLVWLLILILAGVILLLYKYQTRLSHV